MRWAAFIAEVCGWRRRKRMIGDLDTRGIVGRVVDSGYEFQAGATQMLVCRRGAIR
ncbi:hypothetical protein ACFXNW_14330 [Nocardia sp. NPDC059180]|uniref:hypothetical protein n=1 Tax=Nocardia sp. NPDC059180 TaxID=3346761 RepID=UPI00369EF72F